MRAPALVIESFESWGVASVETFGGVDHDVVTLREDVDFIDGEPLRIEARRIAREVLGLDSEGPP